MTKPNRLMRVSTIAAVGAMFILALPALAAEAPATPAASEPVIDTGLQKTAATAYGKNVSQLRTDPAAIIGYFIKSALSLVGLVFMVLIIYGGFLWMTARGNEQQVEKAKNILTSSIIGMLIIGAGYALTNFVINAITAATTGVS
jgi:hypothetical protein